METNKCMPDTVSGKLPSEIFQDAFSEAEGMIGNTEFKNRDNLVNNR